MSNSETLKQFTYTAVLTALSVGLFFLMAQGGPIRQAQGQNIITDGEVFSRDLSGIYEDTAAREDCEFKRGRWEINLVTNEYYCNQSETAEEREKRLNKIDARLEAADFERSQSGTRDLNIILPTDLQFATLEEFIHESSIFHSTTKQVDACIYDEKGHYMCGKNFLYLMKKGVYPDELYHLENEEATKIFNWLILNNSSCYSIPKPKFNGSTCTVKAASTYKCISIPGYGVATLNKGNMVVIYVPLPKATLSEAVPLQSGISTSSTSTLDINQQAIGNEFTLEGVTHPIVEVTPDLSEVCILAGATTQRQCAILLEQDAIPQLCKDNQIFTLEGCKRYMLSQRIADVRRSGAATAITLGIPNKCKLLGITDVVKCNTVLVESTIASECREINITTKEECNLFLEDKFKERTIGVCPDDLPEDECIEKARSVFTDNTVCIGLPRADCKEVLKEQHFGFWLAKKNDFEKNEVIAKRLSGSPIFSINRLDEEEKKVINQTIINDRPLYVYPARGSVALTEANELDIAPSALIILDDDGDGLSNEMEKRLGTDPSRKDTDDDGFSDREELQNGFDPLGDGEKSYGFWPIDGAMVYELPLDQPKISEAELEETFIVNAIRNDTSIVEKPLHSLSGNGPANTLLTIYLYSTLPIVLTVQTDDDGNWEYTLEESLADGEHEVFITLVDTFGSITKKSKSFTFFVQEAQAVEADEFFGFEIITVPSEVVPVNQFSRYYLYGAASLVVFALVIAIFFIGGHRSREEMLPEMTDDDIPHVQ